MLARPPRRARPRPLLAAENSDAEDVGERDAVEELVRLALDTVTTRLPPIEHIMKDAAWLAQLGAVPRPLYDRASCPRIVGD